MLSPEQNALLTRIGPGTPMSGVLEHFWFPVLLSEELPHSDCSPKRVRLLGRDLVAFRDTTGAVGILDEHCPHRGASLVLGTSVCGGLRCLYHGWMFDREGRYMETPTEPARSPLKKRLRHAAYPVHEESGIIWTHVGNPEIADIPPSFEWATVPTSHVVISKVYQGCNWLQLLENGIDSAHLPYLHADYVVSTNTKPTSNMRFHYGRTQEPLTIRTRDTAFGFLVASIGESLADPRHTESVSIFPVVMPSVAITPHSATQAIAQIFVPIDDHATYAYSIFWDRESAVDRAAVLEFFGHVPGVNIDENYQTHLSRDNQWGQDRAAMAAGTSSSGIRGVFNQDLAVGESMGRIVERSNEHLGSSDKSITHLRARLLDSIDRISFGDTPCGFGANKELPELHAYIKTIPKGSFREEVFVTV